MDFYNKVVNPRPARYSSTGLLHICFDEHIIHLYEMLWFCCILELSDFEGSFRLQKVIKNS